MRWGPTVCEQQRHKKHTQMATNSATRLLVHTHTHTHTHTHVEVSHAYLATSPSIACCLTWAEVEKAADEVSHGVLLLVEATVHLSVMQTSPAGCVGRPHSLAHGNQGVHNVWFEHCTHSPQTANGNVQIVKHMPPKRGCKLHVPPYKRHYFWHSTIGLATCTLLMCFFLLRVDNISTVDKMTGLRL